MKKSQQFILDKFFEHSITTMKVGDGKENKVKIKDEPRLITASFRETLVFEKLYNQRSGIERALGDLNYEILSIKTLYSARRKRYEINKKIFSGCMALVMMVMVLGVVPTQEVYAASYPTVFMYEDSEFNDLCVTRTMECGSSTALYFKWYRAYNYEKYYIEILDSDDNLVASAEGTPPVSSIGHITINWDTSDYEAGNYTVEVHKKFYSFYQWREAPTTSTYFITLTKKCTHTWDSGTITKAPTVFSKGVKTYTCTSCDETKTKNLAKLKPTIKLSAKKKTLKKKESFKLVVSKLAKGDSIKNVKISNAKIVTAKKSGNKYTIKAKKKGKANVTVILKSGKKATCKITVK